METIKVISKILGKPIWLLVVIYQRTISPDHGWFRGLSPQGFCQFYPSCSQYAALTLEKEGILGVPKILQRLIKCRPGRLPAVDLP